MVDTDSKNNKSVVADSTKYCYYCSNESKYIQPESFTGAIIYVCESHFSYKHWG